MENATNLSALAEQIATTAHAGQKRAAMSGGSADPPYHLRDPYIVHPARVARQFPVDSPEHLVGWLHDVLEDTSVTEEYLRSLFPTEVVDAVVVMTHRPKESYLDYILRIKNNPIAVCVKLSDLNDNLSDLPSGSRRDKYMMAKYILEH